MYALTCERTQTSTVTTPRSVGNTYPGAIFTQADRAVIPRAYPPSPTHTSTRIPLEVQVFGGFLNSECGITWIKFVCGMPEQVRLGAQRQRFKTAELSSGPGTGECGLPRAGRVTTSCQEYSKYSAMKYATVSEVCGL
ncbi:hypothetical protein ALC56_10987 [Trachymyrmex septentrionalis]|uniref:Uncharacterized protein n=1 Tax=Trachymyrmex septentrionalis TaxID=34720 RepID=A0A195F1P8_9HYME|nr:hypothetical protein ALC56_10987 [Trachymyrmex septentrionalis]